MRGSFVGSRNDLEAAYQVAARLGIHLDTEEAPLDAVNEVFRRIRAGTTSSRVLLRPWTTVAQVCRAEINTASISLRFSP